MRAAPSRRRGRADVMGIVRPRRRLPPPPPRRRGFSGGFLGDKDVAVKGKYHALDFFLLFFPSSLQLGAATALTGCAAGGRGGIPSWGSRYVGGQRPSTALSLSHPVDISTLRCCGLWVPLARPRRGAQGPLDPVRAAEEPARTGGQRCKAAPRPRAAAAAARDDGTARDGASRWPRTARTGGARAASISDLRRSQGLAQSQRCQSQCEGPSAARLRVMDERDLEVSG